MLPLYLQWVLHCNFLMCLLVDICIFFAVIQDFEFILLSTFSNKSLYSKILPTRLLFVKKKNQFSMNFPTYPLIQASPPIPDLSVSVNICLHRCVSTCVILVFVCILEFMCACARACVRVSALTHMHVSELFIFHKETPKAFCPLKFVFTLLNQYLPYENKVSLFKHVHIYLLWWVHEFAFGSGHVCYVCKYLQHVTISDFPPQDWPTGGRATFSRVCHLGNWYLLSCGHQGFSPDG